MERAWRQPGRSATAFWGVWGMGRREEDKSGVEGDYGCQRVYAEVCQGVLVKKEEHEEVF